MPPPSVLALAFGLAMDAAAVSAARGLALPAVRPRHALRVALFFGGAQGLMPLVGWRLGEQLGPAFARWDHWVAFVLLAGIGAKMWWDTRGEIARGPSDDAPGDDGFGLRVMSLLAVATSVDALAAGLTLPLLDGPPPLAALTIGLTTAALSVAALYAGRRFGAMFGPRLHAAGGVVLVALGVKILVEHLGAA